MDVAKYVVLLKRGLFFARPSQLGDIWEGSWGVPDVRGFRENHADADLASISAEWKRRYDTKASSGMTKALIRRLKERFTFHDLKAKGVSDFEGDKQRTAGHRMARAAAIYDRKTETIKPTK